MKNHFRHLTAAAWLFSLALGTWAGEMPAKAADAATATQAKVQAQAQEIRLPERLPEGHPRLLTFRRDKGATVKMIKKEQWARDVFDALKKRTDVYLNRVEAQPDWLYSRLQMYWKTHATDVFVNGESFDHAGGERAPEPTVKYNGTRGTKASYNRPSLEDIVPYDDDENSNVTYRNNSVKGMPMEKAHPSKTGANIDNVNRQIMGIARDAAFIYWVTGDERYARMAAKVLDVYLAGIYYRNVPIDLNHGQQQTLVGMASFEVIHEDILNDITVAYDFLYDYLKAHEADRMDIYAGALRKWADNIIANGVPHNNWDLFQAQFVLKIAQVLEDDSHYQDGKGREYYLDYILNRSSIRQWSLTKLADFGFDRQTGMWYECPGYSSNVVCDFLDVAASLQKTTGLDLIGQMPVLEKAATAMPQYLFPNRMIAGWGDTHPGYMRTSGLKRLVEHAQLLGDKEKERLYTGMLKCIDPAAAAPAGDAKRRVAVSVNSFFAEKPLTLNPKYPAGDITQYVSPTFYSEKVSWLAQRNGMDKEHSLMISLNGSKGNHMHANGISMELYGKGYVLGPDGGVGRFLYSGLDYSEYYSQFPAHNTVCVDGVSSYPIMMSQHAFKLRSAYPAPTNAPLTTKAQFAPASYSELYFREPETNADQVRTTGIVNTSDSTGYYVDIFRSRRQDGADKMHDYFYHNLGQAMTLTAADGSSLHLKPTDELAFAGGHLYAYSYIYNKESAQTEQDVKAVFRTTKRDSTVIDMTLWMNGEKGREFFKALAPANEEYDRMPNQPYNLRTQPVLTYVARQDGEAWNHPFIAVFEPTATGEPSHIKGVSFFKAEGPDTAAVKSFAGIAVATTAGTTDYIFSAFDPQQPLSYRDMSVCGAWAVISADKVLLGNGTALKTPGVRIAAGKPVSVLLCRRNGQWTARATGDCAVTIDGKTINVTKE